LVPVPVPSATSGSGPPGRARATRTVLYLESLSELGVLGLALVVGVLLVPLAAALRARRHALLPTALAGYAVFLVHAGVDWDWEMPVVTLAGLFCAAALLVAARPPDGAATSVETRPWPLAAAGLLVGLALIELIASGALGLGL
jgi:hypothetical protein